MPTAVWLALASTGGPTVLAALLNFAAPTLGVPSWIPFLRGVIFLGLLGVLVVVAIFVANRRRHRRE